MTVGGSMAPKRGRKPRGGLTAKNRTIRLNDVEWDRVTQLAQRWGLVDRRGAPDRSAAVRRAVDNTITTEAAVGTWAPATPETSAGDGNESGDER
jgi:hypothetical protein